MNFKKEALILIAGILSMILMTAPQFHLRVAGIVAAVLVTGYGFLRVTGWGDTLIAPIPGIFIMALNALLLNYTPLRHQRVLYGLPALIIPLIILLMHLKGSRDEDGKGRPGSARELARIDRKDHATMKEEHIETAEGAPMDTEGQTPMANEEDIIRLRIPSQDLIVAAVLSMILPPIIMAIDPKPVRFMLLIPLIISASYALLSALITGFHERRRLLKSLLTAGMALTLTVAACSLPGGYGHLFLGITGVISSLTAYIRRSRRRIRLMESLKRKEADILERYGIIEDEPVLEIHGIDDKELKPEIKPSRIRKTALKMRKASDTGIEEDLKRAFPGDDFWNKPEARSPGAGTFSDLAVLTVLSLLTLILSSSSPYMLREALFYIQALFVPGYILMSILAPERRQISLPERLFLAFTGSIILTSALAFITGNPFAFKAILNRALTGLSLLMTPIAFIRRWRLGELAYTCRFRGLPRGLSRDAWISIFLGAVLLSLVTVTVYITLNPEPSERFTEFYILGPGGKAYGYPENVTAGENVELIVGVVNREYRNETYLMSVKMRGDVLRNETIKLNAGGKWERPVNFTVTGVGENQKLEFLLYRLPAKKKPYRSLYLFINVR